MAEQDEASSKWTARLNAGQKILQIVAFGCGGVWILYTFVFKEITKTHYITPTLEVHPVRVLDPASADGKFRAFELTISANNPSERDSYIIAAIATTFGHKSADQPDKRFGDRRVSTEEGRSHVMMRDIDWTDDGRRDVLGVAITFPKFNLARGDKATQRYVLVVSSSAYDILEVFTEFHVVSACKYLYPIDRCYEFVADYQQTGSQPSLEFRYQREGESKWKSITPSELRNTFSYKVFQTTQMIALSGGRIFRPN
jgi:hypothetical protein